MMAPSDGTDRPPVEPAWPEPVAAAVAAEDGAVVTRGPGRWSIGSISIHRADDDDGGEHDRHARVLAELDAALDGIAVPRVEVRAGRWLVTRRPPGQPADRPDRHPDPDDLVAAMARGLRALHELPPSAVPALGSAGPGRMQVIDRCRASVAAWPPDTRLGPPYDRHPAARLLEILEDGGPSGGDQGVTEVICHGAPTADVFLVTGDRLTGLDRLDRTIVADRHLDLAVAQLSVHNHLGPEAVFRFYEAYGDDPAVVALDHYVLAAHLLGLAPAGR